ncbi:hypothetical protein [Azospirillum cavernae]|uniref:hypothetical protein n=1 Tax=Azospirillum cavernae TaxID=2320860 RepID=UPI0011C36E95|nr:hypothetical protein [Azospirillum cavernae]
MRRKNKGEEENEVWLPLSDMLLAIILIITTAGVGLYISLSMSRSKEQQNYNNTSEIKPNLTSNQNGVIAPSNAANFRAPVYQFTEKETYFEKVDPDDKLCSPYTTDKKLYDKQTNIKMDFSNMSSYKQATLGFIRHNISNPKSNNGQNPIAEIRIEAHASPGWKNADRSKSARCNMSLSILRAWKVYEFIMNINEWTPEERKFLEEHLVPYSGGSTLAFRAGGGSPPGHQATEEIEHYRSVSLRAVYVDGS